MLAHTTWRTVLGVREHKWQKRLGFGDANLAFLRLSLGADRKSASVRPPNATATTAASPWTATPVVDVAVALEMDNPLELHGTLATDLDLAVGGARGVRATSEGADLELVVALVATTVGVAAVTAFGVATTCSADGVATAAATTDFGTAGAAGAGAARLANAGTVAGAKRAAAGGGGGGGTAVDVGWHMSAPTGSSELHTAEAARMAASRMSASVSQAASASAADRRSGAKRASISSKRSLTGESGGRKPHPRYASGPGTAAAAAAAVEGLSATALDADWAAGVDGATPPHRSMRALMASASAAVGASASRDRGVRAANRDEPNVLSMGAALG